MKNLSLGVKITLGFTILIIISIILGGMAIWNMGRVETESSILAKEYVPEVTVANEIRGAANRIMYEMRGYGFTEETQFYTAAQKEMEAMEAALEKARKLEAASPNLKILKAQLETVTRAFNEYRSLSQQTEEQVAKLANARKQMDDAASKYIAQSANFLASQNETFNREMSDNLGTSRMESALKERMVKIMLVNDVIDLGNEARIGNFRSQALRSPDTMKQAMALFQQIDDKLNQLQNITRQAVNLSQIQAIRDSGAAYKNGMDLFLQNWIEMQTLADKRTETGGKMIESAKSTADAAMTATDRIATGAVDALSTAITVMIIGLVIALVVGVLAAFFITRSITKPVNRIISGLNEGSDQVASASGQVSSASQSMAEGASEQAASIEETSSSMEEMASMTKNNAENAGTADGLMKEANQVVATANDSMERLTVSMKDISQASEETSKIIKTIDEIAFQTNLLALNAAVEAARAGEAGAGFAVVAEEVRNLAMRSAEAAKNTAQLIEGTVKKVNDGSQLVTTTNDAFTKVAQSTAKVGDLIAEISAASREQSGGIDQVNIAITEMDKVVQQNAANAEESASASEEMNAQAEQLRDYVNDLVVVVTGKRNQTASFSTRPRPSAKHSGSGHAKLAAPPRKPQTNRKATEVRPDQMIPFDDDDEDFKNF
jgi:methyl-accepting chemotaxis protein